MSKQGGMGANFYVGSADISGDVSSLTNMHGGPLLQDVTAIDKSAPERIGLLRDGGLDGSIWFDKATGASHPTLKTLPTTDVICSYFHTAVIGAPACSCVAKQVNFDGNRGKDGSYALAVSWVANGFGLEWGNSVTAGKRTDTTATTPGSGSDLGAASYSFGMALYLHLFEFTGTSVTIKVQDSANNSVFADMTGATFTVASGVTSERIALSTTATVRRYLRAVTTGTFSNAVFAINAVRYEVAQT